MDLIHDRIVVEIGLDGSKCKCGSLAYWGTELDDKIIQKFCHKCILKLLQLKLDLYLKCKNKIEKHYTEITMKEKQEEYDDDVDNQYYEDYDKDYL